MTVLSLYDLSRIQSFIFGARRLRANLGAAWLVHVALDEEGWLGKLALEHGCQVLWSGGGNAMVGSMDRATACRLATALSAQLVERAPGLTLACAHKVWDGVGYAAVATELQRHVDDAKGASAGAARFDGGGVCEPCRDTAEPAIGFDDEEKPIGAALKAREGARGCAARRLTDLFDPAPLVWTEDVDRLGRTPGEESTLGVVHLDGNDMGNRFAAARNDGIAAVRNLSANVHRCGEGALRAGLTWTQERIQTGLGFQLSLDGEREVFPVRPVVFGGDDITLLCDGRIALDLAAKMLRAWHAESGFHACAGVALVRAHSPLYRAVRLAHDLCRQAKLWRKMNMSDDASLLQWALHRGGEAIARPYVVCGAEPPGRPWRNWSWLRVECLNWLQSRVELRTQLNGLAAAFVAGSNQARRALERLRQVHDLSLPTPPGHRLDKYGFEANETPYLDAMELLDLIPEVLRP